MLAPVRDPKTGEIILHDIYVAGKWVGSRRTIRQCIDWLTYLNWPSAVMAGDFKINQDNFISGLDDA
jgi:hypothetical protein